MDIKEVEPDDEVKAYMDWNEELDDKTFDFFKEVKDCIQMVQDKYIIEFCNTRRNAISKEEMKKRLSTCYSDTGLSIIGKFDDQKIFDISVNYNDVEDMISIEYHKYFDNTTIYDHVVKDV